MTDAIIGFVASLFIGAAFSGIVVTVLMLVNASPSIGAGPG